MKNWYKEEYSFIITVVSIEPDGYMEWELKENG